MERDGYNGIHDADVVFPFLTRTCVPGHDFYYRAVFDSKKVVFSFYLPTALCTLEMRNHLIEVCEQSDKLQTPKFLTLSLLCLTEPKHTIYKAGTQSFPFKDTIMYSFAVISF